MKDVCITHVKSMCRMSPIKPFSIKGISAASQMVRRRQALPGYPALKLKLLTIFSAESIG